MNFTWTTIFVSILAVSVLALNESENNYLQELIDAGISQETANSIVNVAVKHNNDGADPNKSGKTIFEDILAETNAVIEQAPQADKDAYKSFVDDKKAEFEKPDDVESSDDE